MPLLFILIIGLPFRGYALAQFGSFAKPAGFSDYGTAEPSIPVPSKPVAVISTAAADNSSYSSSFLRFWEDLTGDAIEDLCKAAELDLSKNVDFPNDVMGIKAGFARKMRRFPNGQLALADEISFKPNFGTDLPMLENLSQSGTLPFALNLNLNASVQGRAQVIRPLKGNEYCTEIKTLAKLYNFKTPWPPTEKRISAMRIGEIWKLPLTFHIGAGINASASPYKMITFSLSASMEKNLSPSVTLYRMGQDKMRLRVRIGTVKMTAVGASASTVDIPVEDLALWRTDNFLADLINKEWAREINKALAGKFGFTKTHFKGKKIVLEFICDPNNEEQLKDLSVFLKGNFGILKKFIELHLDFTDFSEDMSVTEAAEALQNMADIPNSALQAAQSYAGASTYDGKSSNFNMQLPVFYKRESQKEKTETAYQSVGSNEQLNVYKNRNTVTVKKLNIPFVGSVANRKQETTSYVVQRDCGDGTSSSPVFMYTEYRGGTNISRGKAKDSVESANELLKYAGTKGNGVNEDNTINSDELLPKAVVDENGKKVKSYSVYKSVASEFKLMISERGIQEIIFAPAAAIVKALFNTLSGRNREIAESAADILSISEDGTVSFDRKAAIKRFSGGFGENFDPVMALRRLAAKATKVIADIFSVKKTASGKEQASKFSILAEGKGTLDGQDFLKVALQLIDPSEITASFRMDSDNKKTGKSHYQASVFSEGGNFDQNLQEVQSAEGRFSDPSLLTD